MQKVWTTRGKEVLDIEVEGINYVSNNLGASFDAAVELLAKCTGRVVFTGIGKSGLIARKLAATFSSTGTPAFFMHPVEGVHGDLGSIRQEDTVIVISYSGKNGELLALLPTVKAMGVSIIALTSGIHAEIALLSDVVIDCTVPREACPMNLAPTASSTATLALGDALAVCLIDIKSFSSKDFKKFHPGGALGERLQRVVSDIMHTQNIPMVSCPTTFVKALSALDKGGLGAVLVTKDNGELLGILTDGDIRRAICHGTLSQNSDVVEYITKNPRHAMPQQSVAELIDIMEQTSITVLPVIDNQKHVVGIVHIHDLLGKGQVSFAK